MLILQSLYFFLPAYFANMAPIFTSKYFPNANYPMDFGFKIRGKRIFGAHKTFMGLFSASFVGVIISLLQYILYVESAVMKEFSLVHVGLIGAILLGFLLGFGALIGDAVKSFFKRRFNIKPGKPWIPFDQIDAAVGGLVFAWTYVPNIMVALIILILTPFGMITVTKIGYLLKLRKEKW